MHWLLPDAYQELVVAGMGLESMIFKCNAK